MTPPKRLHPRSWAADRELIVLAKMMDVGAIIKKTKRKPEAIFKTAKRLGIKIKEAAAKWVVSPFITPRFLLDEIRHRSPLRRSRSRGSQAIEIANSVEAVQDGRIHIELINAPFLFDLKGTPAEYGAGLQLAIERGWLEMHESGTYVKFTPAGAELFAWKRPPIEAALLLLLWMKCGLLSPHPLNQFLDPIKERLIGDAGRHTLVMLDLGVKFDALVTHFRFRIRAKLAAIIDCCLVDDWAADLFMRDKLGRFQNQSAIM
jgi:hypothetical protein